MGTHLTVFSKSDSMNTNMTGMVWMVFKNISVLVLRTNGASALEGLKTRLNRIFHIILNC